MTRFLTPRVLQVVVALVALGAIAVFPRSVTPITFVYSNDAADIVVPAIERFNADHNDIEVTGVEKSSGDAEGALAAGTLDTDAWMPASSAWGEMLNAETGTSRVNTAGAPSAFWSPMAIVTWPEYTKAIKDWNDVLDLAEGSTTLKHAGVTGPSADNVFRYGHTRPTKSTSGLFSAISELPDLAAAEQSVAFYSDIGKYSCEQIQDFNVGYFSATYMQETVMLGCIGDTGLSLTKVFPPSGTYIANYPCLAMLSGDLEKETAASTFCDWLVENADTSGTTTFRTDPTPSPGDTFPYGSNGPSGVSTDTPVRVLSIPTGDRLLEVRSSWSVNKKQQDTLFLVDSCRSMTTGGRNDVAHDLVNEVASRLDPDTRVGVWSFAKDVTVSRAFRPMEPGENIPVTTPSTGSDCGLNDAVAQALNDPSLKDPNSINTIVVVSAGLDDENGLSADKLNDLFDELVNQPNAPQVIAVSVGDATGDAVLDAWSQHAPIPVYDAVPEPSDVDPQTQDEIADAIGKSL